LQYLRVPPGNCLEQLTGIGHANTASGSIISGEYASYDGIVTPARSRLPITTRSDDDEHAEKATPIHPGEILPEEFLKPLGMSMNKLADELHVPASRITQIVGGPPQHNGRNLPAA